MSKIKKKVVSVQLCSFLLKNYIYGEIQSGFRPHQSTETALVKMTNDLLLASDQGCISLLVLLDLNAAFDTIDQDILIDRLQNYTGIQGPPLRWFRSYLKKRTKMAARSEAAATPGPKNCVFMSVSLVSSSSNCLTLSKNQMTNARKHIYDHQSLLDIGNVYKYQLSPATTEKLQGLCLLLKPDPETVASPTIATRTKRRRHRCERGQKRGKHGGIRARLRANPTRPAIPSLMLSNFRSDLIQLSRSTQHETRDCCVFVFTETWLNVCNKVRKEGRKQTGLAREDSGEFYLQINLNRCALCAS